MVLGVKHYWCLCRPALVGGTGCASCVRSLQPVAPGGGLQEPRGRAM